MSILVVDQITKKFGAFTALQDVNLAVDEGEIYGFIGPNGAGKSTTIRIILGILKATEGRVTLFGKDAWQEAVAIHKRLSYVPGDVNLWPNLTGGEVIDLFLSLRNGGSGANKQKRAQLIEQFDFDPTKKCRTYSKGNRQKVALIAAFAANADFYIFDEPTSGLDPLMEQVFQKCVLDVKKEGKSVLLSSHILSEVEKLCDKIGIIRQGQIIETGTLTELRHLTRSHVFVETKQPLSLQGITGVHEVEEQANGLSFQIDSDQFDPVMKHILPHGILKLESTPPTLEDLFMRHYEGTTSPSNEKTGGAQVK